MNSKIRAGLMAALSVGFIATAAAAALNWLSTLLRMAPANHDVRVAP